MKPYNIVMYSHDTYGLGHIRRTMAIASQLRNPSTNILILTGSPIAGRFSFPEQVDFVRIPGMIKKTNEEYLPLSIKINAGHALDIRKKIIIATVKAFQPHLFIVDKEPLGLKKEILPTLKWLRKCCPNTRTVLGLRDIMDDAEIVKDNWKKKGIYQALDTYYSEIWTYGIRDYYDPIKEYGIPESISRKIQFTGYIPREVKSKKDAIQERKRHKIQQADKLVVVTTGGGGDGYPVMDAYLSMLEDQGTAIPYRSILITGPFMPKAQRKEIFKRSRKLKVKVFHFYRQMEKILAAADLVISMGGYNTVCELMSQKTVSLLIPRETPRLEQTLRAQCFSERNLLDYIPWERVSPELLHDKVDHLLQKPEVFQDAMSKFKMTGLDIMRQRIQEFRK
ncbi:MAG: glycosyltransferase [Deltaproteobacteria bacterium]|nr:glycosyltransferase [Deltaproteobacteria bacterium]